ncbi:MAG: hypothetical protein M3Q65_01950 [Chloroflexota bacterium]|nr:hypothetical protein [Chloroflexota bacterium]
MSGRKGRYAEGTTTPVGASVAEIERLLERFNAETFVQGYTTLPDGRRQHNVMFEVAGQRMKLGVPLPDPQAREFVYQVRPSWQRRTPEQAKERYEAEVRRRWRVLVLVVKSKLVAVEELEGAGYGRDEAFRQQFLPETVMGDGRTLAEVVEEQLPAIRRGLPPLLPGAALALPEPQGGGR